MREPTKEENRWSQEVIGAAIEVHRTLGPGYVEAVYEYALEVEFQLRGIPFQRQVEVQISYKGRAVGSTRLDFLVGGCLVVELKALDKILPLHKAQVISYLKATDLVLGLLINFNVELLKEGVDRIVKS